MKTIITTILFIAVAITSSLSQEFSGVSPGITKTPDTIDFSCFILKETIVDLAARDEKVNLAR
ncbi:hypothetical protein [Patiriisocius sp. Uisw_017]|jgi:hypothetical protein|uniref:hypothetical protein n=1 Tax=Patiriisocius sp. Uisw_017 TaxID=3230968 RepID=UPI0039EC4366